jgi:hypothetical protein
MERRGRRGSDQELRLPGWGSGSAPNLGAPEGDFGENEGLQDWHLGPQSNGASVRPGYDGIMRVLMQG